MKIITLVGSSRFKSIFHKEGERIEKSGNLALMMGFFGHADNVSVSDEERKVLEILDRKRIDLSDEVFVINGRTFICDKCGKPDNKEKCCGIESYTKSYKLLPYVGESTQKEIDYAKETGKPVSYLNS